MEIRKFRKNYDGLELILASNANIILGTLVWDPIFGKPSMDHNRMPEHITNAFVDADIINKSEMQNLIKKYKENELVPAGFAEKTIDVDVDTITALEFPGIGDLKSEFDIKKVRKFSFGNTECRTMTNLQRVNLDDYLEELKKNHWKKYDGHVRRLFVITELYYGNIEILLKNEFASELDARLQKIKDLELSQKTTFEKEVEYRFKHNDVPFAMRIEKVKHFNG
jgi:hypothetical protein